MGRSGRLPEEEGAEAQRPRGEPELALRCIVVSADAGLRSLDAHDADGRRAVAERALLLLAHHRRTLAAGQASRSHDAALEAAVRRYRQVASEAAD